MCCSEKGELVVIGGAEDKEDECLILREFVALASKDGMRDIAVIGVASKESREAGLTYRDVFKDLGADRVEIIDIAARKESAEQDWENVFAQTTGVFFAGGDQLRLTSLLGGTELFWQVKKLHRRGVVLGGTSAGAAVMSETMIVRGNNEDAPRRSAVQMAPGMGFLKKMVVDQHFAQRGRIGRLLGVVAHNPGILGVGIDEDTAIIVRPEDSFEVLGSKTVTVLDGSTVSHCNVSELSPVESLALYGVTLHVLSSGSGFDLWNRRPTEM